MYSLGDDAIAAYRKARTFDPTLASADIVLHDSLIGPKILDLVPASAKRVDVGKRAGFRLLTQSDINSLLVDAASKFKTVVRLKGGDPLLFGRAAEEIEALRAANVPFEVVPGISAAFGAAAAAKLSLTDRRLASHVLLTRWLQEAGVSAGTPVLVISKASHPDQSQHATTVSGLAQRNPLPAPALLIVGRVVAHEGGDGVNAFEAGLLAARCGRIGSAGAKKERAQGDHVSHRILQAADLPREGGSVPPQGRRARAERARVPGPGPWGDARYRAGA